jgi:hypothetical protein
MTTTMIAILLLLTSALADETQPSFTPIVRPKRIEPHLGDCAKKIGLPAETSRDCDSISVPPAIYADLYADREWALALKDQYRNDIAQLRAESRWKDQQILYLEDQLQPKPWYQRPGVKIGGGMILGSGLAIAVSYSLSFAYGGG